MNKYKIEKFYKNKKPFNLDSLIPNDIYQTFESNLLPESMFKAASTWIELNPEFNYYFYDKDDRYYFIKENFGSDVLQAYEKSWVGAMKADIWRYCMLYQNGGIYTDIDQTCQVPIINYFDPKCDVLSGVCKNSIHQNYLLYSPKNPILKIVIDQSCERVMQNKPLISKKPPFWGWCGGYTGPVALEFAFKTFLDQERVVDEEGNYLTRWSVEILTGNYTYKNIKLNINPRSFFWDPNYNRNGFGYLDTKYENYSDDLKSLNVKDWRHTDDADGMDVAYRLKIDNRNN